MPRKNKSQRTAYREGAQPTPEQLARADYVQIEMPRIPGHDHGNVRGLRKVSRAVEWCRWTWITEEQCKALVQWEDLHHSCRYDHARSCLDMTPRGFGGGEPSARTAMARKRFDEISKALTAKMHGMAWSVFEWLEADERPDFAGEFGTNYSDAKRRGISTIRAVADELKNLLK